MSRFVVGALVLIGVAAAANPDGRVVVRLPLVNRSNPTTCAGCRSPESSPSANFVVHEDPPDWQLDFANLSVIAHANVIEAAIPWFKRPNGAMRSTHDALVAQNFEQSVVVSLLCFAYTRRIKIANRNVHAVLRVANFLQMRSIVDTCTGFLRYQGNAPTAIATLNMADSLNHPEIVARAETFVRSNFGQVAKSSELLDLNGAALLAIVRANATGAPRVEDVFEGAHRWVRGHTDQPEAVRCEILQSVRYHLMNCEYLKEVQSRTWDLNCHTVRETIAKTIYDFLQWKNVTFLSVPSRYTNRLMTMYDPATNISLTLAETPKKIEYSVVVHDCNVYAIGGSGENNFVQSFSRRTNQWRPVATFDRYRSKLSAVVRNRVIYISGGRDSTRNTTNTFESYHIRTRAWTTLSPMTQARASHRLIACAGQLYAIGGLGASTSVEKYGISANVWTQMTHMSTPRWDFGAAVLNGRIYVCGGDTFGQHTNLAEVFDPLTAVWTPIAAMSRARNVFSVVVYMDRLWALAGEKPADMYDAEENAWTEVSDQWHSPNWGVETVAAKCSWMNS